MCKFCPPVVVSVDDGDTDTIVCSVCIIYTKIYLVITGGVVKVNALLPLQTMSDHEKTLRELTAQVEKQRKQLELQTAQLSVQTGNLPKNITDIMSGKTLPSADGDQSQPYNMMEYLKRTIASKQSSKDEAMTPPPLPPDPAISPQLDRPKISFSLSNNKGAIKPVPPVHQAANSQPISAVHEPSPHVPPPVPFHGWNPQPNSTDRQFDAHWTPSWRDAPMDRPSNIPTPRDEPWDRPPRDRSHHNGPWRDQNMYSNRRDYHQRHYDDRDRDYRNPPFRGRGRGFQRPWRDQY